MATNDTTSAYPLPQRRPDESQTAYTMRLLREEIRRNAFAEAASALRTIAAHRQPPTWSANESLAWKEAANYVEDMAAKDDDQ